MSRGGGEGNLFETCDVPIVTKPMKMSYCFVEPRVRVQHLLHFLAGTTSLASPRAAQEDEETHEQGHQATVHGVQQGLELALALNIHLERHAEENRHE
jgi:hypothetical protein